MKKSILMIFTLFLCFTVFSEEKNVYPIELQNKTVYINSAGKLINNLKTLDEKKNRPKIIHLKINTIIWVNSKTDTLLQSSE